MQKDKEQMQFSPEVEEAMSPYSDVERMTAQNLASEMGQDEMEKELLSDPEAFREKVASHMKKQEGMKEDLNALLSGEELSEEFRTKAETIFEAAVEQKTRVIEEQLKSKYETISEEYGEYLQEEYAEKIDKYIDYVVESWVEENQLAIESGIKSELTEGFLDGLRTLFEEHYVDVPESKVDALQEAQEEITKLKDQLNETFDDNVSLKNDVKELQVQQTLNRSIEGLTEVEKDRIRSLAEGLSFDTVDEFEQKLNILKDSYLSEGVETEDRDEQIENLEEEYSPDMNRYLRTLNRYNHNV
jgi:hypothetical protein